jgi:hypothetical protein
MLAFKEIFTWDAHHAGRPKRTLLFSQRGWYYYLLGMNNDRYYTHGCRESHGGDRVLGHRSTNVCELRCVRCNEMAPSQFQAVVTLNEAGRYDGSTSE